MTTDPQPINPAPWLNRGTDPVSRRVYALIFNGLTGALTDFMPLSERERLSSAIYDSLRTGGVEVHVEDGLAKLASVSREIEATRSQDATA